jgi:hypothetical protein
MAKTKMYKKWHDMKQRCFNPKNRAYKNYGGRGVTVCEEWNKSFKSFMEWSIANGYDDELQIDRIDNNGNYEPSNCRYVSAYMNTHNRRVSKPQTIDEVLKFLKRKIIVEEKEK